MRKVFTLIVLLITLSVLGIILIQMFWIKDAISLKQAQFQREVNISIAQARESLQTRYIQLKNQFFTSEDDKEFYLANHFTSQIFSKDDISQIIDRSLKKNNIKQPFEFCITNYFKFPIILSDAFPMQNLGTSYVTRLTPFNSDLQETLYVYVREDKNYILRNMAWMIIASIVFTAIILSAFALTVRTLFNQKKLSEIKSDFINNMTHELKTPLATISLAIDALTNQKVINDTDKIRYYSAMIKEENKRMNKQVEKILQAARLERQDIKLNLQPLDAHQVIQKVTDNLLLQIQEKQGTISLKLDAAKHNIEADEVHFANIIFNLLDNAIKYSKDNLHIEVETHMAGNNIAIRIRDNGIGMTKETQYRIFEKFYRAHTGNIHNVKGFGLGLSYVKAMVDAHHAKIKVESVLGKGSTFTIYMPATS
ncbi:MAG: HAMP domain-containing histidine kinase [Taibaiella sp.]|nr:HAMP domain-containing histidine kinase [Taibaiella sp.]